MEMRHLRCFLAVAEELHFARAAERLHIDQSPLSRAIKELEEKLGAPLFVRSTRNTRLTRAGRLFLEHVPRIFSTLDQARAAVRAVAAGYQDQLRIALSDGIVAPRLSSLMAQCRVEDPEVSIHFEEVSLEHQIRGLHEDFYDLGFSQCADAGDGVLAEPVWYEPLQVAIPVCHPLLAYSRVPLAEVLRYPLVMGDVQACGGYNRQIERLLQTVDMVPLVEARVVTSDLMMAMVGAGFALALVGASQVATSREANVVSRPLAGCSPMLVTYLLRRDADNLGASERFIRRVANRTHLRYPNQRPGNGADDDHLEKVP